MTKHLTFIFDIEYKNTDKYYCKSNKNIIIYIPYDISRINNNPKKEIRISID